MLSFFFFFLQKSIGQKLNDWLMTKIKTDDLKAGAKSEELRNQHRKGKKKKRRLFWQKRAKYAVQKIPKDSTTAVGGLPPKTPQEVSSNWKTLQEVRRSLCVGIGTDRVFRLLRLVLFQIHL